MTRMTTFAETAAVGWRYITGITSSFGTYASGIPEYEYLSIVFGGDDGKVFLAAKEGRTFYLDESGKEVLTHVKRFPNEELKHSPFWLVTDKFDYFTTISYVGSPQESNPNVVKLDGAWVEGPGSQFQSFLR